MNESDRRPDAEPDDAAWQQVARLLAGETTPAEADELRGEMARHPGRAELVSALDAALRPLAADARADVDVEAALARVMARRDRPVLTVEPGGAARAPAAPMRGLAARRTAWWAGPGLLRAAAAVLVVVAGALVWRAISSRNGSAVTARYATPVGTTRSMRLADGTVVVLGPASRVEVIGRAGRTVKLDGEAYFQVRHHAERPFTVSTGDAVITDVGTEFNISTDSAAGTAVAVREGVVALGVPGAQLQDTLRAGDRGRVMNRRVMVQRGIVTHADVAWASGRLVFRDATVAEVAAGLRRWYGVTLRVDPSLAGRHLTADFTGQTAEQAMQIVAAALGGELRGGGASATVVPRRAP
ncbi:MAG TPA: FecR domain-containing protein [Longimicrobium sp.]|nr:FecR domain-containing protein [Longimicrobium sp.]